MNFEDLNIDYVALAEVLRQRRTYVADVAGMRAIFTNLAASLGFSSEEIEQLCALEVGFPTDYSVYRSTMRGGANNHYVGPTQVGRDFWIDVRGHKPALNFPVNREDATLEMQIAAPFIYGDRYRSAMIDRNYPLTIPFLYALHQQGVGAAAKGFPQIAGLQSKRSIPVVRSVQHFVRTGKHIRVEL